MIEVSGGITLENVAAFGRAGADLISSGSITNSAPVLDIGLDVVVAERHCVLSEIPQESARNQRFVTVITGSAPNTVRHWGGTDHVGG